MLQAKEKEKKQDLHFFFFPIVLLEESYDKCLTLWNKANNKKKTHTHIQYLIVR